MQIIQTVSSPCEIAAHHYCAGVWDAIGVPYITSQTNTVKVCTCVCHMQTQMFYTIPHVEVDDS